MANEACELLGQFASILCSESSVAPTFTPGESSSPPFGPEGPAQSVPPPPSSHLLPLSPCSLCSRHTGLLTAPQTCWTHYSLRTFAQAASSAWNTLALVIHWDCSLTSPGLYKYHECVRLVAQSCPTLCNLINCSPPGSSVHGIL